MKKYFIFLILVGVGLILGKELLDYTFIGRTMEKPNIIIGEKIFFVEIADEPLEQIKGLSGHVPLADDQAMIFIFPDKQVRSFWMKDMLFPIDIIWIENNKIVKIDKNLPPEGTRPSKTYSSITTVDKVMEINAGLSDKYGFRAGDKVEINLTE